MYFWSSIYGTANLHLLFQAAGKFFWKCSCQEIAQKNWDHYLKLKVNVTIIGYYWHMFSVTPSMSRYLNDTQYSCNSMNMFINMFSGKCPRTFQRCREMRAPSFDVSTVQSSLKLWLTTSTWYNFHCLYIISTIETTSNHKLQTSSFRTSIWSSERGNICSKLTSCKCMAQIWSSKSKLILQ